MSQFEEVLELYSNTVIERHELVKAKEAMKATAWEGDATLSPNNMTKWVTREQGIECIHQAIVSCDLSLLELEGALEDRDFSSVLDL